MNQRLAALLRYLKSECHLSQKGRARGPVSSRRPLPCKLALEPLEDRTLLSVNLRIAVMGDSLSAPYAGHLGRADDRSWTEQLSALRSNHITIDNEAVAGATSSSLLEDGQHTAVASLVASGAIDDAVLIVGANDVEANLPSILAGDPTPFVTTVVANIETAANTVAAAGNVGFVIGNIPDVSVTPAVQFSFQAAFGLYAPFFLQEVSSAIALANAQIEDFAAARGIPIVDLFGESHLTTTPITIGGVQIDNLYAPDGFHPGTVAQGIIANTILEAFHVAYDVNVHPLRLSDQDILNEVDIRSYGRTFFDVSSFVLFSGESDGEFSSFRKALPVQLSGSSRELTSPGITWAEPGVASGMQLPHEAGGWQTKTSPTGAGTTEADAGLFGDLLLARVA